MHAFFPFDKNSFLFLPFFSQFDLTKWGRTYIINNALAVAKKRTFFFLILYHHLKKEKDAGILL